jgi:hypothetical protein
MKSRQETWRSYILVLQALIQGLGSEETSMGVHSPSLRLSEIIDNQKDAESVVRYAMALFLTGGFTSSRIRRW